MEHPSSRLELGRRLSAVLDLFTTRQEAADVAERSTDQLLKYVNGVAEPPLLPLARLCEHQSVRFAWLAYGEEPMRERSLGEGAAPYGPSHDLSEEHLTIALELADRAVGIGWLPRPLYSRLVRLIYQGVSQGLPVAEVEQFAVALARKLAQGDAANGGESGLGTAGGGGAGGGSSGPPGAGNW